MLTVLSICMRFRCHPGLGLALKYYLPRYASCEFGGASDRRDISICDRYSVARSLNLPDLPP
jgi:hypothetical protein